MLQGKTCSAMPVTFEEIVVGAFYGRVQLAKIWGYKSFHAIARGVVTPSNDNKITLFVTKLKQESLEQYTDSLLGDTLEWEGPNDHFAESRMMASPMSHDELYLFYRERHHSDILYLGNLEILDFRVRTDKPSQFRFRCSQPWPASDAIRT